MTALVPIWMTLGLGPAGNFNIARQQINLRHLSQPKKSLLEPHSARKHLSISLIKVLASVDTNQQPRRSRMVATIAVGVGLAAAAFLVSTFRTGLEKRPC